MYSWATLRKYLAAVMILLVVVSMFPIVSVWAKGPPSRTSGDKRIVGYLPYGRLDQLNNIDFSKLTNLIYFSLGADSNGSLTAANAFLVGLPNVVRAAHTSGVKVSVCVGGGQSNRYFTPLAGSSIARANFITQLVNFVLDRNLDGVDLDWEPVANADVPNYSKLIKELKRSLNRHGLLLSIAVNSGHHDIQAWAANYLDFIGVMAYDMNWPHAEHTNYENSTAAMTFWAEFGIAKSKLLMGIPFYGASEGRISGSEVTYAKIIDKYNPTPDQNWTPDNVYFFNGIDLVKKKTAYVKENGFGGIMIWNLGQDKFDDRSLLSAIVS